MSAYPPPPPPPRRLERSSTNKVFGGVCAGVANYLNMDVNLVRVLTVVVSLFTGVPVVQRRAGTHNFLAGCHKFPC